MCEQEKLNPTEENIGLACKYWVVSGRRFIGCNYLKSELEGQIQCGGFIKAECVFRITGKIVTGSEEHLKKIRINIPL